MSTLLFLFCASISAIHKAGVSVLTLALSSTPAEWKSGNNSCLHNLYSVPGFCLNCWVYSFQRCHSGEHYSLFLGQADGGWRGEVASLHAPLLARVSWDVPPGCLTPEDSPSTFVTAAAADFVRRKLAWRASRLWDSPASAQSESQCGSRHCEGASEPAFLFPA